MFIVFLSFWFNPKPTKTINSKGCTFVKIQLHIDTVLSNKSFVLMKKTSQIKAQKNRSNERLLMLECLTYSHQQYSGLAASYGQSVACTSSYCDHVG